MSEAVTHVQRRSFYVVNIIAVNNLATQEAMGLFPDCSYCIHIHLPNIADVCIRYGDTHGQHRQWMGFNPYIYGHIKQRKCKFVFPLWSQSQCPLHIRNIFFNICNILILYHVLYRFVHAYTFKKYDWWKERWMKCRIDCRYITVIYETIIHTGQ